MKKATPYIIMFLMISLMFLYFEISKASAEISRDHEKGEYPYTRLVNHTDSIKVFFTENKKDVTCHVRVITPLRQWQSEPVTVSKLVFEKTPLMACLPRKNAQGIYAHVWAENITVQ
ncbi:hypothetical protein GCM10007852_28540 [Agaribacter marinus]|uniref:Uncharacterized protein n=2 Tax=Agaribacter marinus TaxID=1431249 RepID=A0AA37SY04_9ALTE|nr:hypothetical protein GCM10007852_28540 [Agaribacter marinus]